MDIVIKDNTLVDNKYEVNPMNGGSGISLYDPYQLTNAMISGNHIEGSLWGVTVIGCKNVNLGRTNVGVDDPDYNEGRNTFKDNGNNGLLYDLYNNSANTVYAQNNTWNVSHQTQEEIENVIFHKADDASLGEVIYWPAAAPVGIREVEGSEFQDSSSKFYDLRGVRHNSPQKGINIVRKNGRANLLLLRTRGNVKKFILAKKSRYFLGTYRDFSYLCPAKLKIYHKSHLCKLRPTSVLSVAERYN